MEKSWALQAINNAHKEEQNDKNNLKFKKQNYALALKSELDQKRKILNQSNAQISLQNEHDMD